MPWRAGIRQLVRYLPIGKPWQGPSPANTLSSHYARSVNPEICIEPLALSDLVSRTQVEGLDLYHDYYRPLGVADDLSVNFGNLSHRVCLAVLRGRRGFSGQDRAILAAIRPHMERAYRYSRGLKAVKKSPRASRQNGNHPANSRYSLEDLGGSPGALSVLGLSAREAEVLYWVAAGKSGPVISTILGIRHDTVRSHLKKSLLNSVSKTGYLPLCGPCRFCIQAKPDAKS